MTLSPHPVFLVAFGEEDNLGVGYLMSVLNAAGIETRMIDFRYDNDEILASIRRNRPVAVGFSVIFEKYIGEFAQLVSLLRREGITTHFTAGGYYASLHPESLLELIPGLDSIVRFEGESTFLELINCLIADSDWKNIRSLAYRENGTVTRTPVRPLQKDLDSFPFPSRRPLREYTPGRRFATIIAGRGCVYNCTFCNTREFYRQPGGPLKRIRRPEAVVSEMHRLFIDKRCIVFLFQDDDFPLRSAGNDNWIRTFCSELDRTGLTGKVIWKINCRPDEVDPETFSMMKQHGLFLVFIGLEDGTDEGLARLNKRMTASDGLYSTRTLRDLGIGYDYGLMLFQPESDFRSLRENVHFLERICGDGYSPIAFLKLLPYFDTQVEKDLRAQGRLRGEPGNLDYDFRDESLDACWSAVYECFAEWQWSREGVVNLAKWVRNYLAVRDHFENNRDETERLREEYHGAVTKSNHFLAETFREIFDFYESGEYLKTGQQYREKTRIKSGTAHQLFCDLLKETLRSLHARA